MQKSPARNQADKANVRSSSQLNLDLKASVESAECINRHEIQKSIHISAITKERSSQHSIFTGNKKTLEDSFYHKKKRKKRQGRLSPSSLSPREPTELKKSIDTLMISTAAAGRFHNTYTSHVARPKQTILYGNNEHMFIDEQQPPPTVETQIGAEAARTLSSRAEVQEIMKHRTTHLLGSLRSERFEEPLTTQQLSRQQQAQMIAQLNCRLENALGNKDKSEGRHKNQSVNIPGPRYDMSVGIRAKVTSPPKKGLVLTASGTRPDVINQQMRKTVTLNIKKSDQLTGSTEQIDKLNSSIKTASEFLELTKGEDGKTKVETHHPTVIELVQQAYKPDGIVNSNKLSNVKNVFLGKLNANKQELQPRTSRSKNCLEQALLDHILHKCEDPDNPNQKQSCQRLSPLSQHKPALMPTPASQTSPTPELYTNQVSQGQLQDLRKQILFQSQAPSCCLVKQPKLSQCFKTADDFDAKRKKNSQTSIDGNSTVAQLLGNCLVVESKLRPAPIKRKKKTTDDYVASAAAREWFNSDLEHLQGPTQQLTVKVNDVVNSDDMQPKFRNERWGVVSTVDEVEVNSKGAIGAVDGTSKESLSFRLCSGILENFEDEDNDMETASKILCVDRLNLHGIQFNDVSSNPFEKNLCQSQSNAGSGGTRSDGNNDQIMEKDGPDEKQEDQCSQVKEKAREDKIDRRLQAKMGGRLQNVAILGVQSDFCQPLRLDDLKQDLDVSEKNFKVVLTSNRSSGVDEYDQEKAFELQELRDALTNLLPVIDLEQESSIKSTPIIETKPKQGESEVTAEAKPNEKQKVQPPEKLEKQQRLPAAAAEQVQSFKLKRSFVREEPDKIVKSTLQAISLTKQYEKQKQQIAQKTINLNSSDIRQFKQFILSNENSCSSKEMLDGARSDLVTYNNNAQHEKQIVYTVGNFVDSDVINKSLIEQPSLKTQIDFIDTRQDPLIRKPSTTNVPLQGKGNSVSKLATQCFKPHSLQQLKMVVSPSSSAVQDIKAANYERSPSRVNSTQKHPADSATEKSSLNPQYMISKLDVMFQENTQCKQQFARRISPSKNIVAQSALTVDRITPIVAPANPLAASNQQQLLLRNQNLQNSQNKQTEKYLNERLNSKTVVLVNKQSSSMSNSKVHILHLLKQDKKQGAHHQNLSRQAQVQSGSFPSYNSIEAKSLLLGARVADQEVDQIMVGPPSLQNATGSRLQRHQNASPSHLGLKGKHSPAGTPFLGKNFKKKNLIGPQTIQLAQQTNEISLKVCGIRQPSIKDLESQLRDEPCQKVQLGEKSKPQDQSIILGAIAIEDDINLLKEDHKLISPLLIHQFSGLPYVEDTQHWPGQKSHNVSMTNLPLLLGRDATDRTLENHQNQLSSPSGNFLPLNQTDKPGELPQQPLQIVGTENILNYYQLQGIAADCCSESGQAKITNEKKLKMKATQTKAATPSRVSESMKSLTFEGQSGGNSRYHRNRKQMASTDQGGFKRDQQTASAYKKLDLLKNSAPDHQVQGKSKGDEPIDYNCQCKAKLASANVVEIKNLLANDTTSEERVATNEERKIAETTLFEVHVKQHEQQQQSPDSKEREYNQASKITSKIMIGNRSQSLAPPAQKVHFYSSRNSRLWKGAAGSSLHKKSDFTQQKQLTPSSPVDCPPSSSKNHQAAERCQTEPIFSQSVAPAQKLPKMKNPSLIEHQTGLTQNIKTPLHKLLTFDQFEELQSLLGSKKRQRKYNNTIRFKDQSRLQSVSVNQNPAVMTIDESDHLPQLIKPSNRTPKTAALSPMSTMSNHNRNFTPAATTNNSQISKLNTVEHLKRMQAINAQRKTQVVFIDPVLGTAALQPGVEKKVSQTTSTTSRERITLKKQTGDNSVKTRQRTSPFQQNDKLHAPFTPATHSTTPKREVTRQGTTGFDIRSRNITELNSTMPAVLSSRNRGAVGWPETRKQRKPMTFIFNDMKNLEQDLRKNSALVQPIFRSQVV